MKLKEACEIADECGLSSVGEAVMFAELHYDALVSISNIDEEFAELYREAESLGPRWEEASILDVLKDGNRT